MQVEHDWYTCGTVSSLESYVKEYFGDDFKFKGPGLYTSDKATFLIFPTGNVENPWKQNWPINQQFSLHAWDLPFHETVLSLIATAPTRLDSRKDAVKR